MDPVSAVVSTASVLRPARPGAVVARGRERSGPELSSNGFDPWLWVCQQDTLIDLSGDLPGVGRSLHGGPGLQVSTIPASFIVVHAVQNHSMACECDPLLQVLVLQLEQLEEASIGSKKGKPIAFSVLVRSRLLITIRCCSSHLVVFHHTEDWITFWPPSSFSPSNSDSLCQ